MPNKKIFFILFTLCLNEILLSLPTVTEIPNSNEETNILLKRSINLDHSSLERFLASRSLNKQSKDKMSFSDLNKRNDGKSEKFSNFFFEKKIRELTDSFLKSNTTSLGNSNAKNTFKTDLNWILNAENDKDEEEIFKKSQALGLNSQKTLFPKTTSIFKKITTYALLTTTKTTPIRQSTNQTPKIEEESSEKNDEEDEDQDDSNEKQDELPKKEKKKLRKKQPKKSIGENDEINNEKSILSSKQLKQVYQFLRKKQKNEKKEDSSSTNDLINSLLTSPSHEVHLKLKDSLAAKAANDALLKWHSKVPFAGLDELEEMYNKFYEFYYDYFNIYSSHGDSHFHMHHHPRHNHHRLNLLEFLSSKTEKPDKTTPKNFLFDKIIQSNYLTKYDSMLNDHHHYDDLLHHPHHLSHHPNDYYHYHHSNWPYIPKESLGEDPYYLRLKSKMNFYLSKNLEPPTSLLNEMKHLKYHSIHDHTNDLDYHGVDDYETHFNNPNPHQHYHYSQYPIYDEFGRKTIFTTGQFEHFPQSTNIQNENLSKNPVVCSNYPDHSTEGFKSFISVESCNQPSFLSSNGIPLFGNGCAFRYMCEFGYQPIGGFAASIKCNNGFWTARAVCIKQGLNPSNAPNSVNSNQQNVLNRPSQQSAQTLVSGSSFQSNLLKRSDSVQNPPIEITSDNKSRLKRSFNDKSLEISEMDQILALLNSDSSKMQINSNNLDRKISEYYQNDSINDNSSSYIPVFSKNRQLIDQILIDLNTKTTKQTDSTRSTILQIFPNKKVFPEQIEFKPKNDVTDQSKINSDPNIKWSNIIDSDSEKTIYESFNELLEDSSNKSIINKNDR
ncbi:unnamed protein product [Brachionus calyciflorus]|uniref:Sushi domain-containing protein n=1 Tax=Brachionus calyciflorus TaxID=104777 RepID=A0A813YU53_9BILA|nr:unnamed protein product [Brachionus calyciflorus]